MWSKMNVVSNECSLKWMWSQMNVVSNECGLKRLWSQMNVVSNDCGLKWMWSQMNVVSNDCGLKWMWSQMSMGSNDCGLKWSGLKWMWSQMNRSNVVVSNERGLKWSGLKWMVSNELVSIVCTPIMVCGSTSDFIGHPLAEHFVSARGASHHAWAPDPHHLNLALGSGSSLCPACSCRHLRGQCTCYSPFKN